MDIGSVFAEVKRVLAPGGVLLFAEEPLRRMLSLRLYRCPYYEQMKPWERRLSDWGLLGYLVKDVIGAAQEEGFGIRQNHGMNLKHWHGLVEAYFAEHRYEIFAPERGWGERLVKRLAVRLDPLGSVWTAARLLGGTLAAVCRKEGPREEGSRPERFEDLLHCPDCHGGLTRRAEDTLSCECGYQAPNEDGVYNLLPSKAKRDLYPGNRGDIADFAAPGHESMLIDGWYQIEGVFGNKYRWIGPIARLRLAPASLGGQKLRIRGHAPEECFKQGQPVRLSASANGQRAGEWTIGRTGLFVLEAELAPASEYRIEIQASPTWQSPPDDRVLTVNLSLVRLVEPSAEN